MKKIDFSEFELQELEATKILGGSGKVTTQNQCNNSADGCGVGSLQNQCTNSAQCLCYITITQSCNENCLQTKC